MNEMMRVGWAEDAEGRWGVYIDVEDWPRWIDGDREGIDMWARDPDFADRWCPAYPDKVSIDWTRRDPYGMAQSTLS